MTRRVLLSALLAVAAAVALVGYGAQRSSVPPRASGAPAPVAASIPSAALGHDMPVEVWLPAGLVAGRRYPVIYLFHGRGGDETTWFGGRQGNGIGIDVVAADLMAAGPVSPLRIVSARVHDSYGRDLPAGREGYAHGAVERRV